MYHLPQNSPLHHQLPSSSLSIRQHTSAFVSIRQHMSAYVSIRQHTHLHSFYWLVSQIFVRLVYTDAVRSTKTVTGVGNCEKSSFGFRKWLSKIVDVPINMLTYADVH